MKNVCWYGGCDRWAYARGLCKAHSRQKILKPIRPRPKKNTDTCVFNECDREVHSSDLCYAHYRQKRLGRSLTPVAKVIPALHRDDTGRKPCRRCGEYKSEESFPPRSDAPDKLDPRCSACRRDSNLMRRYGITSEEYELRFEVQGGGCGVCGSKDSGTRGTFHMDHDHTCCPGRNSCGKCVRGILCESCNLVLGKVRDSTDTLWSAITYLKYWEGRKEQ